MCKVESHSESAAVILEAGETAAEHETHLSIWENVLSDDLDVPAGDARMMLADGEAICLYRALEANGTAIFDIAPTADPKKTTHVQLSDNDILMLTEHDSLVSGTSTGVGYQLWVQPELGRGGF